MSFLPLFRTQLFAVRRRLAAPTFAGTIGRKLALSNLPRTNTRQLTTLPVRNSHILGQSILYGSLAATVTVATKSQISCDSGRSLYTRDAGARATEIDYIPPSGRRGAFGLDYRELSVGSFVGLFVGFLVGKFSKFLVFFASSTFLFLQFLSSRRIIALPYNRFYSYARRKLGDKELMLENMSFKVAFGTAAMIAAANA
ncbi:hypothetical protein V1512DRAFT_221806 [Lipomyces arxii]|uniref:uncharacterized protein n=1 Tax=Lipomyces arxii TaxID=56418 RepID=UPI0034CF8449